MEVGRRVNPNLPAGLADYQRRHRKQYEQWKKQVGGVDSDDDEAQW